MERTVTAPRIHELEQPARVAELATPSDPSDVTPEAAMTRNRSTARLAIGGLVLFVILARLPAVLASKALHVDEGVFGASVDAMREGWLPFRDVFSSHGPLFLPVLWIADVIGSGWMNAIRIPALLSGVALTVACYAIARRASGVLVSTWAAIVIAGSGSVAMITGPAVSDGLVMAFGALGVLAAIRYREGRTTRDLVVLVVASGSALAIKSVFALPAVLVVAVIIRKELRLGPLVALASGLAAFLIAVSLPWGLGNVWQQSVAYHSGGSPGLDVAANLRELSGALYDLNLLAAVVVVLCVALAITRGRMIAACSVRGVPPRNTDDSVQRGLLVWTASTFILLIVVSPLSERHLGFLIPPLVLWAIALERPRLTGVSRRKGPAALLTVGLCVVALLNPRMFQAQDVNELEARAEATADLQRTPSDAWVITDLPQLAWRADRGMPPDLVDADAKRIRSGDITAETLRATAADPRVCTILIWGSEERYRKLDFDPAVIGYRLVKRYPLEPEVGSLFVKSDC